ncbi:unnamed protein product [Amoebophrya sp. A25]|nr:unnamed protein product [Amoebophrya sp. A25]|eukprot:GSA25T00005128001.1
MSEAELLNISPVSGDIDHPNKKSLNFVALEAFLDYFSKNAGSSAVWTKVNDVDIDGLNILSKVVKHSDLGLLKKLLGYHHFDQEKHVWSEHEDSSTGSENPQDDSSSGIVGLLYT